MTDHAPTLPGFEPPPRPKGTAEESLRKALDALRQKGVLQDHHEHWIGHALDTARELDASIGEGRPSGRAALRDSYTKILENLPTVEVETTTELDAALAAILDGSEAPRT